LHHYIDYGVVDVAIEKPADIVGIVDGVCASVCNEGTLAVVTVVVTEGDEDDVTISGVGYGGTSIRVNNVGALEDDNRANNVDNASSNAVLIRHIANTLLPMLLEGSNGSLMYNVRLTDRKRKKHLYRNLSVQSDTERREDGSCDE
jgi:hypothetical protein